MEGVPQLRFGSVSLPPGCRFYPSDEQLLRFYLSNKNSATITMNPLENDATQGYNLIKELNLFDYDPFDLPDFACFSYGFRGRKKHWYYYTVSVLKKNRGSRRMKSGYWKMKGRVREVNGREGTVLGIKRSFVFYLGNSIKNAVRTDWVMYEYALSDPLKASLVLHRVFLKSGQLTSISDKNIGSNREEGGSALCHIGIQHDEFQVTNMVDEACETEKLNTTNDITRHQMRLTKEPNFQLITGVASATPLQLPPEVHLHHDHMITSSLGIHGSSMPTDVVDNQRLISILEGDFLELDDLVD